MVNAIFRSRILNLTLAGIASNATIIGCEFIPMFILSIINKSSILATVNGTIYNVGFSYISTGIYFILTSIAKSVLRKFLSRKTVPVEKLNPLLLPLPLLSIIIVYYIMFLSAHEVLSSQMLAGGILIILCLLIVNFIVFASDSDSKKKYQYRAQISEMNSRQEMQKALIMQQESHIQEMNALTHDFKHQLLTLQNLVSIQSPNGDASAYIAQAIQNLPKSSLFIGVSCSALRSILIHTSKECARLGIMFNTELRFTDFDFMTYQDICTIFSNTLDNALRTCSELRNKGCAATITLKTDILNHMVSISVSNDKINDIVETDGKINTTKKEPERHGLGITNVTRTAEKYGLECMPAGCILQHDFAAFLPQL